ncbi:glycosyltransferase [Roseinatronobacter sp.]|uniref:glycosyltransferase n=1 Tax=Roseinatronobacter sp. TaxID=1945755 RepID=UPI0025D4791F|nr:glycosyltransferase [Rhodobaca sp.]
MTGPIHIDVCICTFRRDSVTEAIRSVAAQVLPKDVTLRLVVADNDDAPSAKGRVLHSGAEMPIIYVHAPARNISIARNACLEAAQGEFVAFLDDDETAPPDWIATLWSCLQDSGADAVFGPARAVYPPDAPDWITRNDFLSNLPQQRGGAVETGHTCNVLMRKPELRFREDLGRSGGEDTDFFFRLGRKGFRFAICEQAIVHEVVDPRRLRLRWLADRRFAEGRHYGATAPHGRMSLFVGSGAKAVYSALRTLPHLTNPTGLAFWGLRSVFHAGVCFGALAGASGRKAYG